MDVAIIGVGLHPFGRHEGISGHQQGVHAARAALADAGIGWSQAQFAFGGSDAAGNADAVVRDLGLTGLPFMNVSNGCATGGSALIMADRTIRSGAHDLGLAVGFDKHPAGAFNADPSQYSLDDWYAKTGLMLTTQFFGMKIQRYAHEYGISASTLAKVAEKAYRNGVLNPNAWRRTPKTEPQILASPMVNHPLTKYMFCSPAEGAAAVVLCRADLATRYTQAPIYLRSAVLQSRRFGSFEVFAPSIAVDRTDSPTVDAARAAFEAAGIGPDDVDVSQLQDTESGAEVMHMAECGLCKHGEQERLVQGHATKIGGALPINTDGGCLANGEPIGASGLRQVCESVLQLRGQAGPRQVPGSPKVAFTHVYGAPGISACTVLSL